MKSRNHRIQIDLSLWKGLSRLDIVRAYSKHTGKISLTGQAVIIHEQLVFKRRTSTSLNHVWLQPPFRLGIDRWGPLGTSYAPFVFSHAVLHARAP